MDHEAVPAPMAPPEKAEAGGRRPHLARMFLITGTVLFWGGGIALFAWERHALAAAFVLFGIFLALILISSFLVGRVLISVTIEGSSMLPTYREGDRVIVRRRARPRTGLVVVVELPEADEGWLLPSPSPYAGEAEISGRRWMIKRVAAVPGDHVPPALLHRLGREGAAWVPPGMVLLLGDNEEASFDSRYFGYFPQERVLGVVLTDL
ncbi:S26 family signal peptidase [Streptosporangium sp. NPDC000239]|uniref:S26 family signal peptidase n=1 Tax=Streptosporangium sp. NPDC000239 TaxID=3154248 RepID=UPI0033339313